MCRRRRWLRSRRLVKDMAKTKAEAKHLQAHAEGWEYAPLFNMKFHHKERKMDLVRRRRWHRKMIADSPNAPCFFQIEAKGGDSDDDDDPDDRFKAALTAPRMFLICQKAGKYQLRAYIYQARDLLAGDSNGLSDPFARVVFLNQSDTTERLDKTLCPTWDQTLIFEQVDIHGNPADIAIKPPEIVIEIFDYDTFGGAEFLGRTKAYPMVKHDALDSRSPVLQWHTIHKGEQYGGELLAAFELLRLGSDVDHESIQCLMDGKDLPFLPPKRGKIFIVPNGIRPVMQRTAIEVMCWGVRNMAKYQLAGVTSPSVEMEVGGHIVQSKVIRNTKKNPNFDNPLLFFDIMLPKEELYTPPVNIRVRDNRQFGRKPMVGVHVVKSLEHFRAEPNNNNGDEQLALPAPEGINGGTPGLPPGDHIIDMPSDEKTPILDATGQPIGGETSKQYDTFQPETVIPMAGSFEEDIDWWSTYYASTGDLAKCKQYLEQGYDKIEIFDKELEKVGSYSEFDDFCHTFILTRGKNISSEGAENVGEFKGSFCVYPLPGDPNEPIPPRVMCNLPPSTPEECVIRVYIINAQELQPNDSSGLADPYIDIKLGKHKVNSRDTYLPNTLNPEFGRMFEIKAVLPMDKDLYIRVKDYDLFSTDDVIGETVIDLENRLLSKYRATCGLPHTYCVTGPTIWRDSKKPKDLLEDFCVKYNITPTPIFTGNHCVKVGNRVYNLTDFELTKPSHKHLGSADQRLALYVLNTLPGSLNVPLVPQHVETRPLYNPLQPGIEQGKLQMWVDIFPASLGPPGPAADILTRKPKRFELRVILWNTKDVILEEESITGEKMSDIYVKGWLSGDEDDKQETDVHYRSLDGEGNFNWRFVFPFDYLPAEECVVIKRKEHFWSLDETELKIPPNLMIQIWDNDKFSADDFLGTLELNLNNMPAPTKKSARCTLDRLPNMQKGKEVKMVSMFEQKRVKGYWPCYSDETGTKVLTGKVEMEIELVSEGESQEKPAGRGQSDPNQHPTLDAPNRPATSFLWFTSPWKTLKLIIWRNYKWYFITGIIIFLIVIFVILFIYAMPSATVNKIFG